MHRDRWPWLAILGVAWGLVAARGAGDTAAAKRADDHFRESVKPLLDRRCVSCHGPDSQKGHLRLDSREAVLRGGDLGPSVVPEKPSESLLLQAVMHARPDLEMPPKDKLTAADIAVFERWILDGAPWPESATAAVPGVLTGVSPGERLGDAWSDPRNPITRLFNGQRLDLWSFRPVARPAIPVAPHFPSAPAPRNEVDAFIRERLAAGGLEPSGEADRRTLARRVHFDLTGLPPSPGLLEAFLNDAAPDAYERLVDRLLNSPEYGEHQARLWLDVVRYSDSNGFDWDEFRPEAWRYRDYVIRSFNQDKPFDQFIREQLAGDEFLEGPPRTAEEQDLLIATGYLRVGPQDNSASLFNEQGRARAEWMADLTETTGSAFLGLTLSCCRCHDHKYDPLSQADHFRFRAFFQPLKYADEVPLDLAKDQEAIRRQHAQIDAQIQPFALRRDELLAAAKKRIREQRTAELSEEDRRLLAFQSDPQPQDFKEQAEAIAAKIEPSDDDARKAFQEEEKKLDAEWAGEIKKLTQQKRPFTRGLMAHDSTEAVAPTRIYAQGDHRMEREMVSPGFPSALDPNEAEIPEAPNPRSTGRRSALAAWIASPENPLTSRVLVNRVWQSLFGRGLVATPNDFGLAGARPTHPELLDWLAAEFLARGTSMKALHRLLVSSAVYRQSSTSVTTSDADNIFYSRQNPRRLSAEQLRDSMLQVSGLLRTRPGGKPVWPELPPEVLQANPAFLDDNAEKTKGWYPSPEADRAVRSIYLVQKRTVRVPFLETFDLPDNSVSCPQRTVSIAAPQALALLNGDEALKAARALADRVRKAAGDPGDSHRDVVRWAFTLALQREPTPAESAACDRFLERATLPELCRALLNLNEFAYRD